MNTTFVAENEPGFHFDFLIEKAFAPDVEDLVVIGVASTPNIDHDKERMAEPALKRMARIINEKSVPLRVEHQKGNGAIVGDVDKAWIDDRNKLWVQATLDKNNPAAMMLHSALKAGAKLGLSVGGRVKRAVQELNEGQGQFIRAFHDVTLEEVSVTPRPSNYDAWLLNKNYIEKGQSVDHLYNSPLYDVFLFENPKFDYLASIEKSIPKDAWKKVEPETNNNIVMDIKNIKKTETTVEESTKPKEEKAGTSESPVELYEGKDGPTAGLASKAYVDQKFADFSKTVADVFRTELKKFTEEDATGTTRMADAPPAEEQPADDQHLPDDKKEENPAQERAVKTGANGSDELGQREKTPGASIKQPAHDQDNPDGEKKENPAQVRTVKTAREYLRDLALRMRKDTVESSTSPTAENETKEKADTSEKTPEWNTAEGKKEEKAATETSAAATSEDLPTAHKAEDDSEDDSSMGHKEADYKLPEINRNTKKHADIDMLAFSVAKSIDDAEAKFAKSGKRVPGFRQVIVDFIRQDSEIQKSIREMMRQPGEKKSVIVGTPYAFLKDGTRLRLIPDDAFVQKSFDPKANFKETYKTYFSSQQDGKR